MTSVVSAGAAACSVAVAIWAARQSSRALKNDRDTRSLLEKQLDLKRTQVTIAQDLSDRGAQAQLSIGPARIDTTSDDSHTVVITVSNLGLAGARAVWLRLLSVDGRPMTMHHPCGAFTAGASREVSIDLRVPHPPDAQAEITWNDEAGRASHLSAYPISLE
jgi:hypothetical protein